MSRITPVIRGIIPATLATISVLTLASAPAVANPSITALFDPGAGFTPSEETVINDALAFYNTNMTSTFSAVIDFSTQAGGGATSHTSSYGGLSYSDYYSALATNAAATGNAAQLSAVASLPNQTNNPVTGTDGVSMTTSLASLYGFGSQVSEVQSSCGGLTGAACVQVGIPDLGTAGMLGEVQHEVDEVLGTSSALPNGGGSLPTEPNVADLFRYSAPGVRSFATNPSTDEPCTGPTAYFSVNGGVTNQSFYNNCNNGGDYGDWGAGNTPAIQVQDAFGDSGDFTELTLASPEVTLLEAVGFDFVANSTTSTPEPTTIGILVTGLAGLWRARRPRAS